MLNILTALDDPNLKKNEKWIVALSILFPDFIRIKPPEYDEAIQKMLWFLSLGQEQDSDSANYKLYDWEKDEQYIMSAVNKVAGVEVRALDYLHFWTFMGYFNEIEDGVFSTIVGIRAKKARGIILEPHEKQFYKENKKIIEIRKIGKEEQDKIDYINKILG